MPGIDPTYRPRAWMCEECRNILGIVMRDNDRVRRLWVLRVQAQGPASLPSDADMIAAANSTKHARTGLLSMWRVRAMDSGEVGCDNCGAVQEWSPGAENMRDLLRKVGGQKMVKQFDELMRGAK